MTRVPPKIPPNVILRHWREAVPDDRLAHLVRDATRAYARALQLRLLEHSVSFGHWSFLRILWVHDGLTQRELSIEAGVMEPTTHAAVNAMEKLGYVKRRRNEGDRRNTHIRLTVTGKRLKGSLVPLAIEVNEVAVNGMAAADVAATRRVLLAAIENLATDEQAGDRKLPSTREWGQRRPQAGSARKRVVSSGT